MTTKTIHYADRTLMQNGKTLEASNGFRAVNTDFTNNDQRDGFDVFYDNRIDVIPPKRQLTENQYIRELAAQDNVDIV